MRKVAIALLLLGAVLLGGGLFFGCGYYAEWNGRNVVHEAPLVEGETSTVEIPAKAGKRYTFSARVTIDTRGVAPEDAARGASSLELEMPFAIRLTDGDGAVLLQQSGVLGHEPPTSVYGDPVGGANGRGGHALVAERFLGPYPSPDARTLRCALDLGADRRGKAKILGASLVAYDDQLPPRIKRAFGLAGAGAVVFFAGMIAAALALARRFVRPR